jgi:acyl-CoA thioester hydrolase
MGIVHHANYIRYLELSRIAWMDEHDRPYRDYVEEGLHFATTRVEFDYRKPAVFDDRIEITTWLDWVRGVSLAMRYEIRRGVDVIGVGMTEHALIDGDGRPARIPAEHRRRLKGLAAGDGRRSRGTADRSR